jgi:hypothetical protein
MVLFATTTEIWPWYQHASDGETFQIASEPEYGVEIYALKTKNLSICVSIDGEQTFEEYVEDEDECQDLADTLCSTYLSTDAFRTLADEEKDPSQQEMVDDREGELDAAIEDCLGVILFDTTYADIEKIREDVKEHLLRYLYERHGLLIYRPMFLVDEDGDEFFEEFPYDCMEFGGGDDMEIYFRWIYERNKEK